MKLNKEIFDLLSLLKVFDANYVSDEDSQKLQGLDVNNPADIAKAVDALLIPEFRTYPASAQNRLTDLLRTCLADSSEDFMRLFDRVKLAFDDDLIDKRLFMSAMLDSLALSKREQA